MFKSILRIGELISSGGSGKLPIEPVPKDGTICFVVFDDQERKVYVEKEKIAADDAEKYAYIGDAKGQKPQDRLTTKHLEYILGFNFKKDNKKARKNNKKDNGEVGKNKFALEVVKNKLGRGKTYDLLSEILQWYPSNVKELNIRDDDWKCSIYTVRIKTKEGEFDLATLDDYKSSLLNYGEVVKGRCQFCGSDQVLKDPAYTGGSLLKVFITDKKGFLSDFEYVIYSHSICPKCKYNLEMGLSYVKSNLTTRLGNLTAFLIPDLPIYVDQGLQGKLLNNIKVNNEGYILEGLKEIERGEREAYDFTRFEKVDVRLDLVFGEGQKNKFKLWRIIQEIEIPRLVHIMKLIAKGEASVLKAPNGDKFNLNHVSFNTLYGVLPARELSEGKKDPRVFLEFLEAMLLGNTLDYNYVYTSFLSVIRCVRFGTCNNSFTRFIFEDLLLYQEVFIYVMRELGIMGANINAEKKIEIKDVKSYADSLGLSGGLKGIFLLGVLTAYVGKEQVKKGNEKKAILDKVDYEGMDYDDIVTYANRLFESLRDYKQLGAETELIFSDAITLVKSNKNDLSDTQANVFHLLLGYAYQTKIFITSASKNKEQEESSF